MSGWVVANCCIIVYRAFGSVWIACLINYSWGKLPNNDGFIFACPWPWLLFTGIPFKRYYMAICELLEAAFKAATHWSLGNPIDIN